ncbi:MAG: PaaI family thioesterase [Pseudomonadota bacterium]
MPPITITQGPDAGWLRWQATPGHEGRFAQAALPPILWREEGKGRVRARMATSHAHTNNGGVLHGGFLMSFADMALFAIAYQSLAASHAVTVTCNFEFLGVGYPDIPIEALGEVVHETGKTIFIRALATQEGRPVLNFSGTLRKIGGRAPAGDI